MGQVSGHLTRLPATYENTKKAVVSKPVNVTVWRWIPLKEYAPYYEAQPGAAIFGTTTFNGVAYSGWGAPTYSHTGAWESRCTPGRHCKSFKAVLVSVTSPTTARPGRSRSPPTMSRSTPHRPSPRG
jgi:hypothetical protein